MTDTAQPGLAAENVALADAADAFKAFVSDAPIAQPRDPHGRFAPAEDDEDESSAAGEGDAPAAEDSTEPQADEAADAAQPDAVPLPLTWNGDKAALWGSLPPEAQAYIAERDGEQTRAVNQKFQEAASLRRANEAVIGEAHANRERFAEAADLILAMIEPTEPDPGDFISEAGFDAAGFALAQHNFSQSTALLEQIAQQRHAVAAQLRAEQEEVQRQAHEASERQHRPAFLADVPAIADPAQQAGVLNALIGYAVGAGIPHEAFTDPAQARHITSAQLHLLWKAMQYDRGRAARARVRSEPRPEPRKALPPVRPGVVTPRAAHDRAKLSGAMSRLDKEGSVEAGAAVFKHFMKGR